MFKKIIQLNEEVIKGQLNELARGKLDETAKTVVPPTLTRP